MLKILIKKQIKELLSPFTYDKRKGKKQGVGMKVLFVIVFGYMFMVFGAMFFAASNELYPVLHETNLDWLFFALIGIAALALGVFGSVFSTYSELYVCGDNDLLLSYPIKPIHIVLSRLFIVYIRSFLFQLTAFVPALIVYFSSAKPGVLGVICTLLMMFMLSFVTLVITCFIGWLIALALSRIKRKNIVNLVISAAFLVIYFYAINKMQTLLPAIIQNADGIALSIRHSALYPFYLYGAGSTGSISGLAIFSIASILLMLLTFIILCKSFVKLATAKTALPRTKFRGYQKRSSSVGSALFTKELKRLIGSPVYLLNCGMSSILMLIASVAIIIKASAIRNLLLSESFSMFSDMIPLIPAFLVTMLSSMALFTAPSISLEGKTLWVLKSYPIPPRKILFAKLKLHMVFTLPFALLLLTAFCIALKLSVLSLLPAALYIALYIILSACISLIIGLHHPNLDWKNEALPIKQDPWVMLSMLFSFLLAIGPALIGIIAMLVGFPSSEILMLVLSVPFAVGVFFALRYITGNAEKRFELL